VGFLDTFEFLEVIFDDWFEKGYLYLAIPVLIAFVIWLALR